MTAVDSAPRATAARSRPTMIFGAAFAVALIGIVIYALVSGDARHLESGDPFPGTLTAAADVVGYFLGFLAAALTLGGLVFVITASHPDDHGTIDVTGYRTHLMIGRLSVAWAVLSWLMVAVAAADASGTTPWRLVTEGYLGQGIGVSETAVAWIVMAVCATVIAVLIRCSLGWMMHVVLLIPSVIAMVALPMASNAGQGPNHDYNTSLGIGFSLAVGLSLGFRVAWASAPRIESDAAGPVVHRRNALILVISDAVAVVYALGLIAFLLPARYAFDTAFGIAAIILLVLLAATLGSSVQSYRAARRGDVDDEAGRRIVTAGAVLMVGAVACWTVMDTRVAPGLLAHKFSAWDVFLGYELPGAPTAWKLATYWRFDLLIGVAAIVAILVYLIGVRRLRRRGDEWPVGRTISWVLGCLVVVVVTGSGVRAYGSAMFSVHMAEHMALNMFAPVLLVLGAPATLALRALPAAHGDAPPGPREWLLRVLHSKVTAVLSNPIVALAVFVLSLYVVYFTGIFGTLTRYHWGHVLLTVHFIIVGYLFYWVIIGIDPGPRRIPFLARIGLLFAVMPFHAFFGIALMTMSTVVGDKFYSELMLPWVTDRLHDQWLGGAIAWGASEVPVVLVVVAIVAQWAKVDRREANRGDRHADTYEDTELDAYNAMLDELSKSRR
ncbi:cytochrome c oxidase assembly protein [Gordonia otitidis]|uniref:cytochrome c oxidase assembly protein n=1 Tax=Gordonia otitidis TaxID=249058 RepID=UPI001D15ADC2|nr:cytochrome c oxidase assembly protein [Gordonia otitidis]UEA58061.1 cytochrome c oxidase assembly protein [Gordonia otitidis]